MASWYKGNVFADQLALDWQSLKCCSIVYAGLLKMLLYWQSIKCFGIVGAVLLKLLWSFMIAFK